MKKNIATILLAFYFYANCIHDVWSIEFSSLDPPVILKPIPTEYGDDKRLFQGIPSMSLSPEGRVWVNWYTGGDTEGDENYVLLATSGDRANSWTKPLFAIDIPGPVRAYDPAMWTDPDGKVWLFWAQSKKWWDGRSGVWCMVSENADKEDAVWSEPRRLCDGIMMCKPIVDSKGRWLLPVSIWTLDPKHDDKTIPEGANVILSEDKGKTWKYLGGTVVPRKDAIFDEHMLIEKKDGSFWMLIRTKYGIAESFSTDGGKTWTDPVDTKWGHPSARFFIRRLQSGNLLLVKHGEIGEKIGRSQLKAFLSDDEGKTWKGGLLLDERNGVSYPDGDQDKDGTIFVVYDFNRTGAKEILMARFTEEDILARKIVSKNSALRLLVNKSTARKPEPKPLEFTPNPNKDGKPMRFGNDAKLELPENAKSGVFKAGAKLFFNRDYRLLHYPKELEGKKFVQDKLEKTEAICLEDGMVYVFTPVENRNKDSVVDELIEAGFEKVALPENLLFGNIRGNITTLFQKEVKAGEKIGFGKWGVLVY